jgi:hypothetical protein
MAQYNFAQVLVAKLLGAASPNPTTALAANARGSLLTVAEALGYVLAPVSATTTLGTGAIGDVLTEITITPLIAAAGVVQIKDGGGAAVSVFVGGGTTALSNLLPVTIKLDAVSKAGGWSIICGAGVQAIATGQFTP